MLLCSTRGLAALLTHPATVTAGYAGTKRCQVVSGIKVSYRRKMYDIGQDRLSETWPRLKGAPAQVLSQAAQLPGVEGHSDYAHSQNNILGSVY